MSEAIKQPSLARGAQLSQATWNDFVARLKHDCEGGGVSRHQTADALFAVQAKRYTYGVDTDYGGETVICVEDSVYNSAAEYYESRLDEEARAELDEQARKEHEKDFLKLDVYEQHELLNEMDGVRVIGRLARWDDVSSHLTYEAAEAFIARKGHDYRDGLRVYAVAQTYSWEFNAIKEAIMAGRLVLKNPESPSDAEGDLIRENDVLTLIGHAEFLKGMGQEEMPDYFYTLAGKLAGMLGDNHLKQRVMALQNAGANPAGN